MRIGRIIFYLLIGILWFSCKPEKDDTPPKVSILIPSGNNSAVSYDDFFTVSFSASDENEIIQWDIRLTGPDNRIWYTSSNQFVASPSTDIEDAFTLFLNDVHAPSGTYSLGVFVADSEGNEGAAFRDIWYNEALLERERIVVISNPTSNETRIDSLFEGSFFYASSFSGDVDVSFSGSYHQRLLLAGEESPTVRFVQGPELALASYFDDQNPLMDYYARDIEFDQTTKGYWCSFYNGIIREFRPTGSVRSSVILQTGEQPETIAVTEHRIIAEVAYQGTNDRSLSFFGKSAGNSSNSLPLTTNLVQILPGYSGQFFGFGNEGGSPNLLYIDPLSESFFSTQELLSSMPIKDAIETTNGWYALAHSDGVYIQNFGSNGAVFGSNNGVNAIDLAFDQIGGSILALTESDLHFINPNTGMIITSVPVPVNAKKVELLYNK